MRVVKNLAQVVPHIQRAVTHAVQKLPCRVDLLLYAGDMLRPAVLQIHKHIVEILSTRALRRAEIHLRIQRRGRVEQFLVAESLRVDFQRRKRLVGNRIPQHRCHHGHVARLDLLGLKAVPHCKVCHCECTGARLNEPRVARLGCRLNQSDEKTLLRCAETAEEHLAGVSKERHCIEPLSSKNWQQKRATQSCDSISGPNTRRGRGLCIGYAACYCTPCSDIKRAVIGLSASYSPPGNLRRMIIARVVWPSLRLPARP